MKRPLLIPVAVGLLDKTGKDLSLTLEGEDASLPGTRILHYHNEKETFVFKNISEQPVLSVLRNFSAPVKLEIERNDEELAFLMAHDSDSFNRWDAGQQLSLKYILQQIHAFQQHEDLSIPAVFIDSFRKLLLDRDADPAFIALALNLPMENWIGEQLEVIDPEAIFTVLQFFRRQLAEKLQEEFLKVYHENQLAGPYQYTSADAGKRSLKNTCLSYLLSSNAWGGIPAELLALATQQYELADNMTDKITALKSVVNCDREKGDELLADFYSLWKDDPLVVDKWLTIQALCTLPGTLERVQELTVHPAFVLKNPNKVRALIGAFCQANQVRFHDRSGVGYSFLADNVLRLNSMNPQIAARLLTPLTTWKRYDTRRQELMRLQLERIMETEALSGDVAEIVSKSLN